MGPASVTDGSTDVHHGPHGARQPLARRVLDLGMRILPLTAFALLFCAPAKADKFWLTDPKAEQNAPEGSSPNLIEGVLIAESDEGYHVRIVGGEILLPKKGVYKIEKDALTIDAIVKAEQDAAAAGSAANEARRRERQVRDAERDVRAAEATARRSARAVEASAPRVRPAPAAAPVFDPVLGVAGPAAMTDDELMRDTGMAWTMTQDRRYLKLLRQLRRMR